MSQALVVPLVLIIKLYWICILFIFINIPGIYFWKKGSAETKIITFKMLIPLESLLYH